MRRIVADHTGHARLCALGAPVPERHELRALNWTALALAATIVALDLGFLFLYRTGYDVSLGALVTQSTAALLLLVIGVLVFRERLSVANGFGLALCLAGLWLVNKR